jgi:hypothetical protein
MLNINMAAARDIFIHFKFLVRFISEMSHPNDMIMIKGQTNYLEIKCRSSVIQNNATIGRKNGNLVRKFSESNSENVNSFHIANKNGNKGIKR